MLVSTVTAQLPEAASKYAGERLVFWDEFESLDLDKRWKPEISMGGFGNWEFQLYWNNRSNIYTRDGSLYIKPTVIDWVTPAQIADGFTLDIHGTDPPSLCTGAQYWGCMRSSSANGNILNPVSSGRIRTAETFAFKYGRLEVRARLPKGDWLWPAIWLLPKTQSYGPWPASGEIDLMESRGNPPSYPGSGYDKFGSTLHVGPYFAGNMWASFHQEYSGNPAGGGTLADGYHIYGLKWGPDGLMTYLDTPDNVVLRTSWDRDMFDRGNFPPGTDNPWSSSTNRRAAPFDQEYYLIMNVAVGGTANYFPEGVGDKPWQNTNPNAINQFWAARGQWQPTWQGEAAAMAVDYVRIWQDASGADGSSASGRFLDETTAAAGIQALPPAFKQELGNAMVTGAGGVTGMAWDAGVGSYSAAGAAACPDMSLQRVRLSMLLNVTKPE